MNTLRNNFNNLLSRFTLKKQIVFKNVKENNSSTIDSSGNAGTSKECDNNESYCSESVSELINKNEISLNRTHSNDMYEEEIGNKTDELEGEELVFDKVIDTNDNKENQICNGDRKVEFNYCNNEISEFYGKEYNVKIIVAGDANVGKTALVERFVHGEFTGEYKLTLGIEYSRKQITWGSNTSINVELWDMNGNREHKWILQCACRNVHAAVIVYDTSRLETLYTSAARWADNIKDILRKHNSRPIPLILIGSKSDLPGAKINTEFLSAFCYGNEIDGWFITSANLNTEVDTAMTFIIRAAIETAIQETEDKAKGFRLTQFKEQHKKSCY